MRILLNSFCKIIHADNYSNKRFVSFRTRINLLSLLSKSVFNRKEYDVLYECGLGDPKMNCSKLELLVITNGTCNSSSIYVDLGTRSYLFNCGENTGKVMSELARNTTKMKGIFVTSGHWRHIGGLVSTLVAQRKADKNLAIYGPPEVDEFKTNFHVTNKEYSTRAFQVDSRLLKQTINDQDIWKVTIVPVCAGENETETASTSISTGNTGGCLETESESQGEDNKPIRAKYVFNYICQSQDFGLHLNMKACKRRNVPTGPLLKNLKSRMDVTLPNGDVVKWEEVCVSSGRQFNIVMVDCPTVNYLDNFLAEEEFKSCQEGGETPANLIVHFTPSEIAKTEKYFNWMSKFPSKAYHLLLNSGNRKIDLYTIHDFNQQLTSLSGNLFPPIEKKGLPVLKEEYSNLLWKSSFFLTTYQPKSMKDKECQNVHYAPEALLEMPKIFHSVRGLKVARGIPGLCREYHPHPCNGWRLPACHHPKTAVNRLFDPANSVEYCENSAEKVDNFRREERAWMESKECNEKPEYPKIIFLGTGSGEAGTRRSSSGILVFLNEDEIILLDCGEGTYCQMSRFFGRKKVDEIISKLRLIYVSHYHLDHYMGLYGILIKRLKLLEDEKIKRKLALILPFQVIRDMKAFPTIDGEITSNTVVFDSCKKLLAEHQEELKEFLQSSLISKIETCTVDHCFRACGISITQKNGYKITYSGDARPTSELVKMGMNSDVLIHEATFGDNLADMAKSKKHSTVSEAIDIGMRMNAKYTILTHFSQRYCKVPLIDFNNFPSNVIIAFDFMVLNERLLPVAGKLTPLFPSLFGREIRLLEVHSKAYKIKKGLKALDQQQKGRNEGDSPPPLKIQKTSV